MQPESAQAKSAARRLFVHIRQSKMSWCCSRRPRFRGRSSSGELLTRFDELRKQRFGNLNQLANTSIDQRPCELAPFPASGFRLQTSDF